MFKRSGTATRAAGPGSQARAVRASPEHRQASPDDVPFVSRTCRILVTVLSPRAAGPQSTPLWSSSRV